MGLTTRLEHAVDAALRYSPMQPFFRWRGTDRLLVLAYHEVPEAGAFAWQVDYLRTHMQPVSLGDVVTAIRTEGRLPPRAVLITFDDGDRTVYENALPVLSDRSVPAVTFVIAGLLGTDIPFWWREVDELVRRGARVPGLPGAPHECVSALKLVPDAERRASLEQLRAAVAGPRVMQPQLHAREVVELDAAGIAIGNHTFMHPCLDRCTDEAVDTELVQAHEMLSDVLGTAPSAFAYPNGNGDARAARTLARLGYDVAFLFDHRVGRFPPADRYAVSRVRVSATTHPDRFRLLVSGLHSSIHHLIGRS
jgi:peptidoglycan/xylan/chitin deacetylase (PgdA/CDA1 family)